MAKTELENKLPSYSEGGMRRIDLRRGVYGHQNDLVRATDIAKSMVKSMG